MFWVEIKQSSIAPLQLSKISKRLSWYNILIKLQTTFYTTLICSTITTCASTQAPTSETTSNFSNLLCPDTYQVLAIFLVSLGLLLSLTLSAEISNLRGKQQRSQTSHSTSRKGLPSGTLRMSYHQGGAALTALPFLTILATMRSRTPSRHKVNPIWKKISIYHLCQN